MEISPLLLVASAAVPMTVVGFLRGRANISMLVSCLASCANASYHTFSAEVYDVATQSEEKEVVEEIESSEYSQPKPYSVTELTELDGHPVGQHSQRRHASQWLERCSAEQFNVGEGA
jgi:hypothetical protein